MMKIKKVTILSIYLFTLSISLGAVERPNILFAIADDWGWPHSMMVEDSECKTPTFERLCREGVRFSQTYVASPSCAPSRAGILSGQHIWRLDTAANLYGSIPPKTPLYTDLLQDAGYHVGSMRKGWGPGKHPDRKDNPAGKQYRNLNAFLKSRPTAKPFCFWFGTSDPHRGYKKNSGEKSGMDLSKLKLPPYFPDDRVTRGDVADYYWEVERFDRELGEALATLEKLGELENTIVVMTSDHGMPFPRGKSTLYDLGARVPLLVRWGKKVTGNRIIDDFVSLTDMGPTFLDAAQVKIPSVMTGRSLIAILESLKSGRVDASRSFVLTGKERHVPCQEAPSLGGTLMRAIRTGDFLYIHNLFPDRWPMGTPDYTKCVMPRGSYADTDDGPTKSYMIDNKDKSPEHARLFDLAFGKRPSNELYDLKKDPYQLNNLAANPEYAPILKQLSEKLTSELTRTQDPRILGGGEKFDTFLYSGGSSKLQRTPKEDQKIK